MTDEKYKWYSSTTHKWHEGNTDDLADFIVDSLPIGSTMAITNISEEDESKRSLIEDKRWQ